MIRANDEGVMARGRPETFEEELDTADGRVTFLATQGALYEAEGQVVGMFGMSRARITSWSRTAAVSARATYIRTMSY